MGSSLPARLTLAGFLVTLLVLAGLVVVPDRRGADAVDAARVAANWVGVVETDRPRREGDEWEIDVVRREGSLVEVTIGDRRELLGLDEELGPGGGPPSDEVRIAAGARRPRGARGGSGRPGSRGRARARRRGRSGGSPLERSPRGGRPRPAAARDRGRIREPGRRVNDTA